jgi:ATP-dependent helicase YprA (DUF1998 family)
MSFLRAGHPQCGSGNQPLDKEGARRLLKKWLS